MKRSISTIIALAIVMSLTSCTFLDELLSVNLFEETFELSAADVASSSIDELLVKSEINAFFETVKSDPAVKTALLGRTLTVIRDPGASPRSVQEAGILGANVLIFTSPAGDLLAKATALADGLPEEPTMKDLLNLVLPDSVYNSGGDLDAVAFNEMINAFADANEYYEAIGESLDGDYLASGASAGDLAVGAFLAAVIDSVIIPGGYDTKGDYLYAALTDDYVVAPDFEAPDTSATEFLYLGAMLDAAKLGDLLDL